MNDLYRYNLYPETEATIKQLESVNKNLGDESLTRFYGWRQRFYRDRMIFIADTYWKSTGWMIWCWLFIIYPMIVMAIEGLFG